MKSPKFHHSAHSFCLLPAEHRKRPRSIRLLIKLPGAFKIINIKDNAHPQHSRLQRAVPAWARERGKRKGKTQALEQPSRAIPSDAPSSISPARQSRVLSGASRTPFAYMQNIFIMKFEASTITYYCCDNKIHNYHCNLWRILSIEISKFFYFYVDTATLFINCRSIHTAAISKNLALHTVLCTTGKWQCGQSLLR